MPTPPWRMARAGYPPLPDPRRVRHHEEVLYPAAMVLLGYCGARHHGLWLGPGHRAAAGLALAPDRGCAPGAAAGCAGIAAAGWAEPAPCEPRPSCAACCRAWWPAHWRACGCRASCPAAGHCWPWACMAAVGARALRSARRNRGRWRRLGPCGRWRDSPWWKCCSAPPARWWWPG